MDTFILGLTGKARAGKDSLAMAVLSNYPEAVLDSFARPLRKFVADILGVSLDQLEAIKDEPHALLGNKTPRLAMQTLGTEWGRQTLSDSIWVDYLFRRNEKMPMVVLADVRFDNEAQAIKDRGGVVVQVVREGHDGIGQAHSSERGVSAHLIDCAVFNRGTLSHFLESALKTLGVILTLYSKPNKPPLRQRHQPDLSNYLNHL